MNFEKLEALMAELPESVRENATALVERMNQTIEGIGDEPTKWYPPLAKLVQVMTERAKLPKGAVPGDIVLGEAVLEKPVKVIPLRLWESRQYWSPDKDETKMICSSPDAKIGYIGFECRVCPHAQFNEETRKSECSKSESVMAVTSDLKEIFVVNFTKTNFQVGKDWKAMMKKAGVLPFRRMYGLSAETSRQHKNVENYTIEALSDKDRATAAELVPFLNELFNMIGADRKEMLEEFSKSVQARKNTPKQIASGADSELPAVTFESDEGSTEGAVSDLAGKYSI